MRIYLGEGWFFDIDPTCAYAPCESCAYLQECSNEDAYYMSGWEGASAPSSVEEALHRAQLALNATLSYLSGWHKGPGQAALEEQIRGALRAINSAGVTTEEEKEHD